MKKLLSLLLLGNVAFAQLTSTQIDSLANNALKRFNVAGCAVAVVKDGKIIHSKGYGVQSISTKIPVTEHTNFAIASNSKAFTCVALGILADEGKINWKDKVVKYIPEFKMYNEYVTQNFTIEDLLTHRSGLGLGAGDLMFFPNGSDFTVTDLVTAFQYFEPTSAFRTQFDYDNLLYMVAGEVIHRVTGQTWEAFVQQRILQPIGMESSYTGFSQIKDKSTLASPHADVKGKLNELQNWDEMVNGAAGGIYANVNDLGQWMLLQLNHGKYNGRQLISEDNHLKTWTTHTVMEAGYGGGRYSNHFGGYGLGWMLSDINGNLVVTHTGGLPGMLSETLLIPDLNFGVVVLTNTSEGGGGVFTALTRSIMDGYLGLEKMDWTGMMETALKQQSAQGDAVTDKVWKTVKDNAKVKINTADYIGIYQDKWFGKVEVFMKGKQLWFKSHRSPKLNGPMQFYKGNSFAIKWEFQDMPADAFAIFSLDEEGKANGLTMKGISPNIDFSFDFQDLDFKRVAK
ncbi:beta-lactamase [Flavobacterium akiainvivens]|uniref:Beta-lactamase n=1 Tax=Flavobacterium akiainvivens TaxID=1202724 RepID=A0A0M9VGX5_9FLAO|nr:serine hydrolase [Flavobacterium akiainvivens]KOS04960.1 beta-lactamase [Flavobacterium akiainvivens]SFQ41451.1 CubicO group peptidase, beta-lactamase class C family [Flavobacterium akiainvivens]